MLRPFPILLALLAISSPAVPGPRTADSVDLASAWRTDPIRVDGRDDDWQGRTSPVKGQRFSIGLQNDGDALYLCLVTKDRVLSTQIERQGLVIWFDVEGAKRHAFGVHFPIDPRLQSTMGPGSWARTGVPDEATSAEDAGQAAVGIIGPGRSEARRVPIQDAGGIAARMTVRGDVLVYELKVPLKGIRADAYVIAASPGASMRLELQTPEWRGPMPIARGPIAVGAAGPGPGGRGMIGYPPVDSAVLKPMHASMTVRLATGTRP